jgi:hypothetical protein
MTGIAGLEVEDSPKVSDVMGYVLLLPMGQMQVASAAVGEFMTFGLWIVHKTASTAPALGPLLLLPKTSCLSFTAAGISYLRCCACAAVRPCSLPVRVNLHLWVHHP